jgi:hypothetical protein
VRGGCERCQGLGCAECYQPDLRDIAHAVESWADEMALYRTGDADAAERLARLALLTRQAARLVRDLADEIE